MFHKRILEAHMLFEEQQCIHLRIVYLQKLFLSLNLVEQLILPPHMHVQHDLHLERLSS